MKSDRDILHVAIAGSEDFLRRTASAIRGIQLDGKRIVTATTNLAGVKSAVLANRPHILFTEIGFTSTPGDGLWLHYLLKDLRERYRKELYLVSVVTDPTKFVFAGNLLFAGEESLAPSGFIDSFVIAPPPGIPSIPSVEAQMQNCIIATADMLSASPSGINTLPALWEDNWAPTMCAPESRDIWLRWLPRYSRYVNENPLIVGPTGSGKTRLAHALHTLSGRSGPFISITPRDFSSTELVQAELFGAVEGAYTGAVEKWGLVKRAEKGTLFIDELQSIDTDLQGKLITFIEDKSYRRVGEAESHKADVRFVFASNRPLEELVRTGRLRDDFAYRLERLSLILPSLNERRLDISAGICFALAKVLRERTKAQNKKGHGAMRAPAVEGLTQNAYRRLFGAAWPGNLRQLENSIAKLIELASMRGSRLIDESCVDDGLHGALGHTPPISSEIYGEAARRTGERALEAGFSSIRDCTRHFSEQARSLALERSGGALNDAAQLIDDSVAALRLFAEHRRPNR